MPARDAKKSKNWTTDGAQRRIRALSGRPPSPAAMSLSDMNDLLSSMRNELLPTTEEAADATSGGLQRHLLSYSFRLISLWWRIESPIRAAWQKRSRKNLDVHHDSINKHFHTPRKPNSSQDHIRNYSSSRRLDVYCSWLTNHSFSICQSPPSDPSGERDFSWTHGRW